MIFLILSSAIITLAVIIFIGYCKLKKLTARITELEYKNKHKIFTGGAPVSRVGSSSDNSIY